MVIETFFLDGVDARSAGIQLQKPIEFSEAVKIIEAQTIPGRNGDLILETGGYENRSGSASCFCLQKDVRNAIDSAGRYLMGKNGYRRLETSDDPDHYWMARVENSPRIFQRLRTLATFEIGFDCKPQRFLKSGETPIVLTKTATLFNQYGQVALPFISVYGQGQGTIRLDSNNGTIFVEIREINSTLFLDSDTQNAYDGIGNKNMNINAPIFPILQIGETEISFDGDIESLEIRPRWWEL